MEVSSVRGVETILFLVVLGTVVAAFAGRLRVPAPSLLVIAGLAVALLPRFPPVHVPPDVVSRPEQTGQRGGSDPGRRR